MLSERLQRLAIAICGASHSGSTLLGLVLGSHSECFYAGEAKKCARWDDPEREPIKRTCKLCGAACPVWSRFTTPPEPDLYEALARLSGKPVIVDSSKAPAWIRARAAELDEARVPLKIVFLARDGRAVINSIVRKRGAAELDAHIARWIDQIEGTRALIEERAEDAITIRYEELASDPEPIVRRICAFAGLSFEPAMLRYDEHEHHPIGGNTGTQSLVARNSRASEARSESERAGPAVQALRGNCGPAAPSSSRAFYERMAARFVLDLRWKTELAPEVLRTFEERAGDLNAPFRWQ